MALCRVRTSPPRRSNRSPVARPRRNQSRSRHLKLRRRNQSRLVRRSLRKLAAPSRPWELPAAAKTQRPRSFRPLAHRDRRRPPASSPDSRRDRTALTPPRPPQAPPVTTPRSCLPSSSTLPADPARALRQEQPARVPRPVPVQARPLEQRALATRHLPQAPALARLQVRVRAPQRVPAGPRLRPPRSANAPRRSPTRQRGLSL